MMPNGGGYALEDRERTPTGNKTEDADLLFSSPATYLVTHPTAHTLGVKSCESATRHGDPAMLTCNNDNVNYHAYVAILSSP